MTCRWVMEEAEWCRHQLAEMRSHMNIKEALLIAERLNDEGIISTAALALRCLAREYQAVKTELDLIEYERTKDVPALFKKPT